MRSPPSSPIAYAGTPWTLQCLPSHDACNDGGAIRGTCLRRSRVGKGLHCLRRLRSMVPVSTQPPWTSSARLRPQASARSLRPHALQEGSKGVRGSRGDLNLMPPSPQQGTDRSPRARQPSGRARPSRHRCTLLPAAPPLVRMAGAATPWSSSPTAVSLPWRALLHPKEASGTRRIWEEFKKEEELPVNGELLWDNGTPFPEPCIDRLAPHIGKYEALAWLCRGLGFFAALGVAAAVNDKASKIPYVSVHC
ncbi:hypothetical protein BDA96_09G091600 [Sorghum bicolor]|uniref:Uncharacterized protein n=1 Tax=Sorghum bicolor TaxID=4558 RepID=A0A921Q961_SORBI|nr:hypothetical protein BDA96_09G091600 [Sorghum bicolor]